MLPPRERWRVCSIVMVCILRSSQDAAGDTGRESSIHDLHGLGVEVETDIVMCWVLVQE
jgi:hypothetical protein